MPRRSAATIWSQELCNSSCYMRAMSSLLIPEEKITKVFFIQCTIWNFFNAEHTEKKGLQQKKILFLWGLSNSDCLPIQAKHLSSSWSCVVCKGLSFLLVVGEMKLSCGEHRPPTDLTMTVQYEPQLLNKTGKMIDFQKPRDWAM